MLKIGLLGAGMIGKIHVDGNLSMTAGYPFTMQMRPLGTKGKQEFSFIMGENIGPESTSYLMWYRGGGKRVVDDTFTDKDIKISH